MQNTATGGHPLHITWANHASTTGRVAVRHFAFVNDSDRFKTTMRVDINAALAFITRFKISRPCIVEQQERAELFFKFRIRKQGAYGKAITRSGTEVLNKRQELISSLSPLSVDFC